MATNISAPSRCDRGAVLVHVAFVLLGLMALSAVVVDFGVFWVGRGQAQNAADAGALAGAVSLAYDNPLDPEDTDEARQTALTVARQNPVWGQTPNVRPNTDITFGPCPVGTTTAGLRSNSVGTTLSVDGAKCVTEPPQCVRVDVYRNRARGNPLPMYFGRLIGLEQQGVRATATAAVQAANATGCLKPWGVPDRWFENYPTHGPWLPTSTFDAFDKHGHPLPHPDVYVPPSASGPGSGFTVETDFGRRLTLKPSDDPISPGFYAALQLTGTGATNYRQNISGCSPMTWKVGDAIPIEPGNMTGPTRQGTLDLIALDPGATWVGGANPIANSCVTTGGCPGYTISPRVVALPIYDVNQYALEGASGRHTTVLVRNILGFFVAGLEGTNVVGYLTTGPGIYEPDAPGVPFGSAFLRTVNLVR